MDRTEHRGITLEQLLDIVEFAVYFQLRNSGGEASKNVTGRTLGSIDADDLQACIGSFRLEFPGVCTISGDVSFCTAPQVEGSPF